MAKSKDQKRREANYRNLVNHFTLIHKLVAVLPGGVDFNLQDYKAYMNTVYYAIYRLISNIQSSSQSLHCTMAGVIDMPGQTGYAADPAMITMIGWDPHNVIDWLFDDNLIKYVDAVNEQIDSHSGSLGRIKFDRHVYDAVFKQTQFYITSHRK